MAKTCEFDKHRATRALLKVKASIITGKQALLAMHCELPYEQQDKLYISRLRHRIQKTRNELRNMQGE
jgi:hypothetical protein